MRARLPLFACLFFAGLGVAPAAEVFSFWPGDGADKADGFQGWEGHPCGEVVRARVSKLPTTDGGPFISEFAVELDARGQVVKRWPMPVDYTPLALHGDELLVTAGDKPMSGFWIRPSGSFKKTSTIPSVEDRPEPTCDLTSIFGNSVHAHCTVFVDQTSRKKRTVGYQGVCT